MGRLVRKSGAGPKSLGPLTAEQQMELTAGVVPWAFRSAVELKEAWDANRESLLARMPPFLRPFAYWELEVGYFPDCLVNGHESDRAALLRLGLPLTRAERELLKSGK
jgi:hypothetical protein